MEIKEALKQREEMLAVSNFFFLLMGSLIGTFPVSSRVENMRHGEFYSLFKFLTRRNISVPRNIRFRAD